MITDTVKSVTYVSGVRVAAIERTVTIADDAEQLGNLYYRLADVCRRIGNTADPDELAALRSDKAVIESGITEYAAYIAGYGEEAADE